MDVYIATKFPGSEVELPLDFWRTVFAEHFGWQAWERFDDISSSEFNTITAIWEGKAKAAK